MTGIEDPQATQSAAGPSGRVGTFSSMANPAFRGLWWSGVFAFLAVGMQITARGWLAVELTDSNASLGSVMLAFGGGMILATPFGGVAADRFSKRTLIVLVHLVLTISAAALGIAVFADVVEFWMLLVSAFVQGASFAFMGPARVAFTGEVVPRSSLPNAVSLVQLTVSATGIVGPSAAGFLIGPMGIGGVYVLTALFTAGGIIPVLTLPPGRSTGSGTRGSPLRELADAVRYVVARPRVGVVVLTTALVVLTAFPYLTFLPRFTKTEFEGGAGWLGALQGANAIGGTVVSLWTARLTDPELVWRLRTVAGLGIAAGVAALGFAPNPWVALPIMVFLGGASMGFQTMNQSTALMQSDQAYHGRVQSLIMLAFSAQGFASFFLGGLADAIGLRRLHEVMALTTVAVVLGMAAVGRRVDRAR